MEHVLALIGEAQLEDPALALPLDHRVGQLRRLERRARRVVVEEVGVDVERVQKVELERVHEVDPHELAAFHPDRLVLVGERDRVHGVDLVRAVEVGVEAVHDHHQLVGLRPALGRIDHECAVEPLRDVVRERHRVAVVEVEPERLGVELVHRVLAGLDVARADARHPVHTCGVDAVEVDRVRMVRRVDEADPQALALPGAQRRPGHAPVVRPRRVLDARGDLDLLLVRDQLPLADAVADDALVEVAQHRLGVEPVRGRIDHPDGADVARRPSVPVVGGLRRDRLGGGNGAGNQGKTAEKVSSGQHQV